METRYAQIEKDLLEIVFHVKNIHTYIYGKQDIKVDSDQANHINAIFIFIHWINTLISIIKYNIYIYIYIFIYV